MAHRPTRSTAHPTPGGPKQLLGAGVRGRSGGSMLGFLPPHVSGTSVAVCVETAQAAEHEWTVTERTDATHRRHRYPWTHGLADERPPCHTENAADSTPRPCAARVRPLNIRQHETCATRREVRSLVAPIEKDLAHGLRGDRGRGFLEGSMPCI